MPDDTGRLHTGYRRQREQPDCAGIVKWRLQRRGRSHVDWATMGMSRKFWGVSLECRGEPGEVPIRLPGRQLWIPERPGGGSSDPPLGKREIGTRGRLIGRVAGRLTCRLAHDRQIE